MDMKDWRETLRSLKDNATLAPEPASEPATEPAKTAKPKDRLVVEKSRKGRGGKVAVIISGFTCPDDELQQIAASLKRTLATGGSARGGEILIQGDRLEQVRSALRAMNLL